MDILEKFLSDTREAMGTSQTAVQEVLSAVLVDHERFSAAVRTRPKPWFFAADETMTVFCTEGRPGNASAPHDHGTWSVLGCFDGAEESWWHEPTNTGLRTVGSGVLRAGQAHSLPADAIHAVMNRWTAPNGVIHVYQGNFLALDRYVWDPVTNERHPAGLSEPLAPSAANYALDNNDENVTSRPALGGTAFAAVTVNNITTASEWLSDTFGLKSLTNQEDSCAVDRPYSYLIEPGSLTIVGLHAVKHQPKAGLDHIALRVPSLTELEHWHRDLNERGLNPSAMTPWNFGTFIDVIGPESLTIRLFVPAVR